jgi:hypothetical protein
MLKALVHPSQSKHREQAMERYSKPHERPMLPALDLELQSPELRKLISLV